MVQYKLYTTNIKVLHDINKETFETHNFKSKYTKSCNYQATCKT